MIEQLKIMKTNLERDKYSALNWLEFDCVRFSIDKRRKVKFFRVGN